MRPDLASALAGAFLEGEWTAPSMVAGGRQVLGRRPRWLTALASQVLERYPRAPRDRPRELGSAIAACPAAEKAGAARPVARPVAATRMVTNRWHLPVLHDLAAVAALLDVDDGELAWFSDPGRWARRVVDEPLRHYRVTTTTSASGSIRVLEAPKPRLKAIQRVLLHEVVGPIPPHRAAHGFRAGHSVADFARPHAGRPVVLRLDLESFFASVTVARVYGILRAAGYPEPVAHCLAGVMTTVLPLAHWQAIAPPADVRLRDPHWRLGRRLAAPHLPQGAPTSPALANLAAFRLDVRLTALTARWGACYTRYADDLAVSGSRGLARNSARLLAGIEQVVRSEGFALNHGKTAVMPQAGRQSLGGLVVNSSPRVSRAEVDRLRALLHNCATYGPSTQNREGRPQFELHLRGRVAWVAQHDPARGLRLRLRLDTIDWSR